MNFASHFEIVIQSSERYLVSEISQIARPSLLYPQPAYGK